MKLLVTSPLQRPILPLPPGLPKMVLQQPNTDTLEHEPLKCYTVDRQIESVILTDYYLLIVVITDHIFEDYIVE